MNKFFVLITVDPGIAWFKCAGPRGSVYFIVLNYKCISLFLMIFLFFKILLFDRGEAARRGVGEGESLPTKQGA